MKIIKEQDYLVKKVKKVGDNWLLYAKGKAQPICLSVADVYGKLPPVWKWPWQSHKLHLKVVLDEFICFAEMDGVVLFDTPEDKYPSDIKQRMEESLKKEAENDMKQENYRQSLIAMLQEYLPKVPAVENIEAEIEKLPVCWRRFMMMFSANLEQKNWFGSQYASRQALQLMYHLVELADRVYKRRVDDESARDVVFSCIIFSTPNWLMGDSVFGLKIEPKQAEQDACDLYKEIRTEMEKVLPKTGTKLGAYLSVLTRRFLQAYANDFAEFMCVRKYNFYGEPISDENEDYDAVAANMELPKLVDIFSLRQQS